MKIAIVIATYYREDGQTKTYLTRALDSIAAQTHKDYRIYLIGDNYERREELAEICSNYKNLEFVNLKHAAERSKYERGSYLLWCAGGVNACNIGINLALYDGFDYVCHLDHDDHWDPEHLAIINSMVELKPAFCVTVATHKNSVLPFIELDGNYYEYAPVPCGIITSASCINYGRTKIRPRDVFAETGTAFPTDADLWQRLADEMKADDLKGYICASLTCYHDEEGYTMKTN